MNDIIDISKAAARAARRRYSLTNDERDDVAQSVALELLRFPPPDEHYARRAARRAVDRWVHWWLFRRPVAQHTSHVEVPEHVSLDADVNEDGDDMYELVADPASEPEPEASWLDEDALRQMLMRARRKGGERAARAVERDIAIVRLVLDGHTNAQIAAHIGMSETHVKQARARLRAQLESILSTF